VQRRHLHAAPSAAHVQRTAQAADRVQRRLALLRQGRLDLRLVSLTLGPRLRDRLSDMM
jgi:hypothetical protein